MLGAQNIFPSSSIVIVNPRIDHRCTNKPGNIIRFQSRAVTVNDAITSDPELTWQIVVGAIAGVAPFVVAGVEFSKRIVEQRNCKVDFCHGNPGRDSLLVKCYGFLRQYLCILISVLTLSILVLVPIVGV
ncbi:uncharacterized protein LOC121746863 isoform X1 [Salvia splendens]|uniref:uncharacterized protein LOC121746863 isoform X1 n=1 Tax=Salvia splendens TaxID=180675 RepID=UPI001C25D307|nr:uncharacterized protein LOC121746863 isoform X1 [Salvia splendens]